MKDSEFNQIKVNNDRQIPRDEFSFAQKIEYSKTGPEVGPKPRDETNTRFDHENLQHKNTAAETLQKTQQVSNAVTKATAVSSGAHAVVVGAAVVSTAVVGAAAGVKMVSDTKANAVFTQFLVEETSLIYCLDLTASKEDAIFNMRVYNYFYDDSRELGVGMNEGYFEGLTQGQTYTVEIVEKGWLSNSIYKESFTCGATYSSVEESSSTDNQPIWNGLIFNRTADFFEEYFTLQLDYEDREDIYQYFTFQLSDHSDPEISYEFELEKTVQEQLVDCSNLPFHFDFVHSTFDYSLSVFINDEEKVLESGEVTFTDISGKEYEVFEPTIDKTFNSKEGTFDITLNYKDPYDAIEGFMLLIEDESTSIIYDVLLEKTTTIQSVSYKDLEIPAESLLNGVNLQLDYVTHKGESGTIYTENNVQFEDIAEGVSEIRSFQITGKANFDFKKFQIYLDYVDDLNEFTSFGLRLTNEGNEVYEFYFEPKDGLQLLAFDDYGYTDVNLYELHHFGYEFFYFTKEDSEKENLFSSGEADLEDTLTSLINAVIFETDANFQTGDFAFRVDYTDEAEAFYKFCLEMHAEDGQSYEFDIEPTSDIQTLSLLDNYGVGILESGEFTYRIYNYVKNSAASVGENKVLVLENNVTFTDVSAHPITTFVMSPYADFTNNSFTVNIEFNEAETLCHDFVLSLYNPRTSTSETFALEKASGKHTLTSTQFSLDEGEFGYELTYLYGDRSKKITYASSSISFTSITNADPTFYVMDIDFTLSQNDDYIIYNLTYDDPAKRYTSFRLEIAPEGSATSYNWYLEARHGYGFFNLAYDGSASTVPIDTFLATDCNVTLYAEIDDGTGSTKEETVYESLAFFSRTAITKVYGLIFFSNEVIRSDPYFAIQPLYVDDNGTLDVDNMELVITTSANNEYRYAIPITSDYHHRTDYLTIYLENCTNAGFDLDVLVSELENPISLAIAYSTVDGSEETTFINDLTVNLVD